MSVEFYNQQVRTARKEHICTLCRRPILKGDEYVDTVCKCYGENLYTSKMHFHCDDLTHRYVDFLEPDEEYNEDDVLNDIYEKLCANCESRASCKYKHYEIPMCSKVISSYRL